MAPTTRSLISVPPDQRRECSKLLNLNGLTAFCYHDRFIIVIHRARHGESTVLCAPLPSMKATRWHLAPCIAPYKYACLALQKKSSITLQNETRVSKTRDSCFKNARLVFQKRETRAAKHPLSLYQQVFREWLISPSRLEYEQKLRLKNVVSPI